MKKDAHLMAGLSVLIVLSRIRFRARIPYGLDSIQFVLALDHFDVRLHQPHPPGYILFVMLGRVFSWVFHDPNLSFVVLNILFSVLAILVVCRLGESLFGRTSGLASALLLATSPIFWFHGEVALSNAVDCFFASLVAWLCWKNLNEARWSLYLSAMALGLSGGIRQNTLVFLLPLWTYSAARANTRRKVIALFVLLVSVIIWYLPMANLSGGLAAYQTALRDHWINSNWHGLTLSWIPFNLLCVSYFILLGTGMGFLFLLLGSLFGLEGLRIYVRENRKEFFFFLLWLAPPLTFFILVYSHPVQTGHSLIYLPAFLLLMPKSIEVTCAELQRIWLPRTAKGEKANGGKGETEKRPIEDMTPRTYSLRGVVGIGIAVLVASNCYVFLGMDTAVSKARIDDYEANVADMAASIRAQCPPDQTILVNADFMFLGFRDLMYHLPEYHTFQLRPYILGGRSLLFSGYLRQTELLDHVAIPSRVRYFILNADEFFRNPGLIRGLDVSRLPVDHFLKTQRGVRWFRGDVRDLPHFFPAIQFAFDQRIGTNEPFKANSMALPLD